MKYGSCGAPSEGVHRQKYVPNREMPMKKLLFWCAAVFWLLGSALILYHPVNSWKEASEQKKAIEKFEQKKRELEAKASPDAELSDKTDDVMRENEQDMKAESEETSGEGTSKEQTSREETVKEETSEKEMSQKETSQDGSLDREGEISYRELYKEADRYNRLIYENRQTELKDAWSYEQSVFSLQSYGLPDEVFGVLRIPKMEMELPLYLGASGENMAKGAVVLGQTSLPIGGLHTNCVIAAHRGWSSSPMFRDIEDLRTGDLIYIDNLWETLVYSVDEISVILPDDVEAVHIQEGKDLVTLITCHPYGQNHHRYVVFCKRQKTDTADGGQTGKGGSADDRNQGTEASSGEGGTQAAQEEELPDEIYVPGEEEARLQMLVEKWLPAAAIPLLAAGFYLIFIPKKKKGGRRGEAK